MTWIDREEISKYLRVYPIELDSIELTPTRRRRVYWTNIPYPPRLPRVKDHPSTFVQSCLHNAIALEEKTGVCIFLSTLEPMEASFSCFPRCCSLLPMHFVAFQSMWIELVFEVVCPVPSSGLFLSCKLDESISFDAGVP
jgi:DNA (cytosine-5)-methyltransferase 3A